MDSAIFLAAMELLDRRFPEGRPWNGGAAVARTQSGRLLTSVGFESANAAASLCYETGVICEAFKYDDPIEEILCVMRGATGIARIAPPCGICRERLILWGDSLRVAIPRRAPGLEWEWKRLGELEPYYWGRYLGADPGASQFLR